jgi:putative ABC transport system permease protein
MFDLENAIKTWLKQFRKYRSFNHASIREMELHLRDHIDDLIASGYSERDAFKLAVKDFGDIRDVANEEFQNQKPRTSAFGHVMHNMLGNHIKIAVRKFTGQPFFTLLNVFGLAIGMSAGLLIALYIVDELSFDKMFADADRVYRINIDNQTQGEYNEYAAAPGPMANVIASDCPQVEQVTRFRHVSSVLMRKPDAVQNVKETQITAVDTSFFPCSD